MKRQYTMIAAVGKTDPIRSECDGPILHIIRHYHPHRIVLLFSAEFGKEEEKYGYMEQAIRLLDSKCEVHKIMTGIENPQSYDDLAESFVKVSVQVKEKYQEDTILLNITSGTPQMESALCMIAFSDSERYLPVQVLTPQNGSNNKAFFNPELDNISEWFEADRDNMPGTRNRCIHPKLLIYKRPLIQHQICSLIEDYDYKASLQLYRENKEMFNREVGLLLEHATYRLNLEFDLAELTTKQLDCCGELYTITEKRGKNLTEFYNSMRVKQLRGELNDFVLRIEVFTEYLAIYLLEKCGIKLEDIANSKGRTNSIVYRLEKQKCEQAIPGIGKYLDGLYQNPFQWGNPVSATAMVHIASFLTDQSMFKKYKLCVAEMQKWLKIIAGVRNPAAHTMIAIKEDHIKKLYDNRSSSSLCEQMKAVLIKVSGGKIAPKAFDTYSDINRRVKKALEK